MSKTLLLTLVAGVSCIVIGMASGDDPVAKQPEPKTYTVACKLTRKELVSDGGKTVLEAIRSKMPDLTTLEGTQGEYHTGGMTGDTPYGFRLQVEVRPHASGKMRLEVMAEDISAEGGLRPLSKVSRQRVVRHVRLGQVITLELERNEKGEGAWVELSVREAE